MKRKRKVAGPFRDLYRQSACLGPDIASAIYLAAQSELGDHLHSLIGSRSHLPIVSATVNPMDYTTADTFSRDYLCAELMSKYPTWDLGIDRTGVALEKFWRVEQHLKSLDFNGDLSLTSGKYRASLRAVEHTARRKIAKILGDFSWDEAEARFSFGPGASTSQPRRRGDAAYKFGAERPQLTYNAEALAYAAKLAYPSWPFEADVVAGARLTTVPKNAKTDRVICIEPDLNMYFQKGIGSLIRRRLQRWGLLLPEAQQINAEFARIGSANGRLATVDLSSASDSIHLELVRLLLPTDWTDAIEQSRSPSIVLHNGQHVHLTKVSSMGNGFTFELETVIFYGICSAVIDLFSHASSDRQCTVFGDDIIIASELVPVLAEVLHFFGFEMNPKKSFSVGPFRESCGKHYFAGTDVTPFYIRKPVDTVLKKYWAANSVRRHSRLPCWGLDGRWQPVYDMIVSHIPPFFRKFRIPEGYGDGGLVSDWDEVCPARAKDQNDAWCYTDIVPRFKGDVVETHGVLLKSLHSLDLRPGPAMLDASQSVPLELMRRLLVPSLKDEEAIASLKKLSEEGLGKKKRDLASTIPKPDGYKKHSGTAHRWPTFGPWI
jgi:hypothetical protein